jgi:glycosyltransferase involved in cell wall biosynthesis
MKIAQVAPLMESVPPRLYGGTERIVSYVTEELVEQGHDVTLFASGDSLTRARLVPCTAKALRLSEVKDPIPYHLIMLDEVRRLASSFDVLHFHVDLLHYPVIRDFSWRTVTTLHGRLDLADMHPLYSAFNEAPLVSISDNQRMPMPPVNWAGRIHHGLPQNLLKPLASRSGDYLAFLGRISPENRPDRAIEIVMIEAMACGTPVIAWKCGSVPEVVDPGVTGFVVDSVEEAVSAVSLIENLDRRRIREVFDQRFTAARMARDYVAIYRRLLEGGAPLPQSAVARQPIELSAAE